MSHRRTPSGDPIPDEIPAALGAEVPDFRWWALAVAVSCGIWGLLGWLIWSLRDWLFS
jgi:hypothetical protein